MQPQPVFQGLFGQYLTALDPVTPGGGRDLLVNATNYLLPAGNGLSYRFDGSTLGLVGAVMPPASLSQYTQFGNRADVDGDGIDDWLLYNFDGTYDTAVVSGADLEVALAEFPEPLGTWGVGYGDQAALSDLDRDGFVDVLVAEGDYTFFSGAVHVYWGPDFQQEDLIGPDFFGFDLFGFGNGLQAGDLDGDGVDEILAQTSGFGMGFVYILRRHTLVADAAQLSVSAGASITLSIDLPDERAGHAYLAALSLSDPGEGLILGPGSYVPMTPDALTQIGFSLLGTPILDGFLGTLDAAGDASFTLNWPAGAGGGLLGQTLHVAAVTAAPDGTLGAGTNDLTLAVVP